MMTAREKLERDGYDPDEMVLFENDSYDEALVAVTDDMRAVYDYDLMLEHLMRTNEWTCEEAVEWVEYNVVRALPYAGPEGPMIIHRLQEDM